MSKLFTAWKPYEAQEAAVSEGAQLGIYNTGGHPTLESAIRHCDVTTSDVLFGGTDEIKSVAHGMQAAAECLGYSDYICLVIRFEPSKEGTSEAPEICPHCDAPLDLTGLIGVNNNQCPACGNPALPSSFGAVSVGTVFICEEFGGMWCKYSDTEAVCVEGDSAYCIGEAQPFVAAEVIYPY